MSMCESILTIALVCTVKYLHYCDYYYTLGNDSQSTPKLIAYRVSDREWLYVRHKTAQEYQSAVRSCFLLVCHIHLLIGIFTVWCDDGKRSG